jgi:hypothetical protein
MMTAIFPSGERTSCADLAGAAAAGEHENRTVPMKTAGYHRKRMFMTILLANWRPVALIGNWPST